jgi:L-ascorbate metabolism protein UlaG (beta-lactamase superfamily)
MDHLDVPSLRKLENPKTQLLMASETSDLVRAARYQAVHEMRWGDSKQVGPARVRALEVNHWGARMRTDTYRGYNGYLIEIAGRRILFAGDTAATGAFRSIKQSRPVDLAIMPIGAYNPWIRYHCTPEQAWRMADDASADVVMPVHHRTFKLSNEPVGEPLERFLTAAAGRDSRVALTTIGATFRAS